MITLYKYLRESIFDDEEEILDNTMATVLLNELIPKLFTSISLKLKGKPAEDICKIENKTLYIDAKSTHSGCANFNQDSLRAFKKIKELTEIDCIESNYNINICLDKKLDSSILCKTIKATSIIIYYADPISDINFELYNGGVFSSSIKFYGMNSLDLKNVTVNMPKLPNKRPTVSFDCMPNISNCKFNGVNILEISDPDLFNDTDLKKKLDNFFDSKHEAFYVNPKKGNNNIKRSSKWIKLKATVNNSGLEFVSSDNNKMFGISPNAKLSDIIDLKAFPDLDYIIMRDNNISVDFNRNGKESEIYHRHSPNILRLPNDPEWSVELYKLR
jgi:hypothetical protein